MRGPVRLISGQWPALMERRLPRLFRPDPRVLLDDVPSPEEFSRAMSLLHVGDTIKITGPGRHRHGDAMLVEHVDLAGASIVDIGVSDGTTSVELIEKLPDFGSYVMADLFLELEAVDVGRYKLFRYPGGNVVLAAGRRWMAWPELSRTVRVLCAPLLSRAGGRSGRRILLLGPAARRLIESDPRVSVQVHDVFTRWPGPPPDVIKVANVLRRMYFSDADIVRALGAILESLEEGGHLLLIDNHRVKGILPRAGLYRREGGRFTVVAETEDPPEIGDLVRSPELVAA